MAHTHLVKGLDYALLQKIRAEQARKEEEDMKVQEEILGLLLKVEKCWLKCVFFLRREDKIGPKVGRQRRLDPSAPPAGQECAPRPVRDGDAEKSRQLSRGSNGLRF